MKKSILIPSAVLVIISLTAFAFINKSNSSTNNLEIANNEISVTKKLVTKDTNKKDLPEFIYDIGPRFGPIKKVNIDSTQSINTFFNEEEIQKMESIQSVEVIIIKNDKQSDTREMGNSKMFTDGQLNLLRSADYSTNFLIRVDYHQKNKETGVLEKSYATPHKTIVPDVQAQYIYGKDALIKYFKENTNEETANIPEDKLKPAKLYFTVTKDGTVNDVHLDRSSGYPNIDELMISLIMKTPGGWIPALNSKGETVNQELVVSFGLMGC